MYQACCWHGHSHVLAFSKRQPKIFDRQWGGHSWRAIMVLDDFAAIGLVDLAVKERASENFKRRPGVNTALAQQRQNLALQGKSRKCVGRYLHQVGGAGIVPPAETAVAQAGRAPATRPLQSRRVS